MHFDWVGLRFEQGSRWDNEICALDWESVEIWGGKWSSSKCNWRNFSKFKERTMNVHKCIAVLVKYYWSDSNTLVTTVPLKNLLSVFMHSLSIRTIENSILSVQKNNLQHRFYIENQPCAWVEENESISSRKFNSCLKQCSEIREVQSKPVCEGKRKKHTNWRCRDFACQFVLYLLEC
jgi:hypothetical protein